MSQNSRTRSIRPYAALAALVCFGTLGPSVNADLLLDYSSGIARLWGSNGNPNGDDRTFSSSTFFTSNFFGFPTSTPFATVSVNGNIYFGAGDGNGDYFVQPLGLEGVDRIAPMWGDYRLGDSGQIIETVTANYYAVTWLGLESDEGLSGTANFQAIFVQSAATINGIDFLGGDIIFSYGEISIYPQILEVIVGLGDAFGNSAALPGHESVHGWHSFSVFGTFPVADNQYALFRANNQGAYDVSIETVVPEPAAYATIAALLGLGVALRHRRASKKAAVA